jgi:tripartite-type tricarboxylate transporter receptor subunit TctC
MPRRLSLVLACAIAALAALPAAAQSWPARPVRVIIPFPPGGTLDIVGRMLAQELGDVLGQQFVVDNRAGGNGSIGAAAVAQSSPDGYTLLFNASTFVTGPLVMAKPPYSITGDFTAIALVAKAPLSVAVNKALPFTDLKGLFAHARANPGKMSFAIGSVASAGHLATELLKRAGGGDYLIVPYKGSTPAYQDLIGGQIAGFVDPVLGAVNHHKAGNLRILAVTSAQRLPTLPDVPTVAETIPGFEFTSWYGLWGPARLPADITRRLNEENNKALAGKMRERLLSQGILLGGGSVAEFGKYQQDYIAEMGKLIADAKIRVE